ncbi:putative secreted protein [Streptomyces davaonensis JCM 4913]|uniref:Putative secreted protein n=1 Tax=Streptomyces davaonensis (strain DSM 101723 / JCM 4913 / KCC S-0913 / 768) TaxID=1214101 RepID=K4R6M0_STRDJ|nr:hypothetical protein [Streptomyces davaonensis]CCK28334.1 putative secreted protein [Streptomyces davaonensis JCM 4913]
MRSVRVLGAGVVAAVLVAGGASGAGAAGAVAVQGPEADLAYHGAAALVSGEVDLRFTPLNHGPSSVPDATVRLRWSEPLADVQDLPDGCARTEVKAVLCRVGALAADEVGERIALRVRLREAPTEVQLEIDTVWNGGAVDRNHLNDRQCVLILDTGDAYYF